MTQQPPSTPNREMLIVTGMSGAGRSTVANALEDAGWYVVDNLPPQMLTPLSDLATAASENIPRLAVVIDIRGGRLFQDLEVELVKMTAGSTMPSRVLFLEASDAALVRRFESVRRPHPLQGDGTITDGIAEERRRLKEVRANADIVIDTSDLNVHQLTSKIRTLFAGDAPARLMLTIMSFGFKHGIPIDVDMMADMRFLPNPYWVPELRNYTGLAQPVSDYVLSRPGVQTFLDHYEVVLRTVIAGYLNENKVHATFAIGCTGGKHRSVATVEELARRLSDLDGIAVNIRHRDLEKE